MKRAPGNGRRCRFTCVGSQVDTAVDGVVVLVGRRRLSGVLPGGLVVHVGVVYERNVGRRVLYSKLRVSHEIVDGGSGFGFFQAFVERATKCVHDTYLRKEKNNVRCLKCNSGDCREIRMRKSQQLIALRFGKRPLMGRWDGLAFASKKQLKLMVK